MKTVKKSGKALGKHVISLHLTRTYQVFKNQIYRNYSEILRMNQWSEIK